MSSPKNIQRDGLYINFDPAIRLTWSSEGDISGASGIITTNPNVAYDFGSATADFKASASVTAGKYVAIGLAMQQPVGDRVPYRVKARTYLPDNEVGTSFLMLGYTDVDSNVGTDVAVDGFSAIAFKDYLDELIILEPNPEAYEGRPVIFGIGYFTSGTLTGRLPAQLSVQNLGVKPPTMQNAVS